MSAPAFTLKPQPPASEAQSFSIRLTVVGGPEGPVDVEATLPAGTTVSALGRELAHELGTTAPAGLWSPRLGALPGQLLVADAGLAQGDEVLLGIGPQHAGAETADAAALELVIAGGPVAGERYPLYDGTTVIGRDPSADVVLNDGSLSRRHVELRISGQSVVVADAGSTNGTAVAGRRLEPDAALPLEHGAQIEAGRSLLSIVPAARTSSERPQAGVHRFNRPPRVAAPYAPPAFKLPAPPEEARRARLPLAAALVPLVMGISMWLIIGSPMMLMFAAMSPMMAVFSFVNERTSGRRDAELATEKWRKKLAALDEELRQAHADEVVARRRSAPDPAELTDRALARRSTLWERRPQDADFTALRLAVADQPLAAKLDLADGGRDDLRATADAVVKRHDVVPHVPLVVRVRDVGAVGIAGATDPVDQLARWLVVQSAVLHSPRDLVIAAALTEGRWDAWSWLGWLPHTRPEESFFDGPTLGRGAPAGTTLLRAVTEVVAQREAESAHHGARRHRRFLLLVLDEDLGLERAAVEDLLARAAAQDVGVLWLGSDRADLPGGCGVIAECAVDRAAVDVVWTASGTTVTDAAMDGMSVGLAERCARALAPVIDAGAASSAAEVPTRVGFDDVLELVSDDLAEDVAQRWQRLWDGRLAAPIGRGAGDDVVVDLRADGPHALVAGTTGAGKSELLQSLVAGLAAQHPPTRLTFLLVDYKGGAAFKDCARLPHTVGMVTDLDEHLTQRALISLNAELRRREEVLHAAGAKDLQELERRDPDAAPPSLAIVVDEFATLAKEVPEFVEGVVDVAQRGRSLGVHVVLATQRPGGVVSESIRANMNLRVALRVAAPSDSDDVIGQPDAARIPRSLPGRAYLRTGHGEVRPFQSAYVGGRKSTEVEAERVVVRRLDAGRPVADGATAEVEHESLPTDLERLVDATAAAVTALGLPAPRRPWLEPLPSVLGLGDPLLQPADGTSAVSIGLVDAPEEQRQSPLLLDLAKDGHALVFGAPGAGKTAFLRTLAVALARATTPDELHLYGVDCAGRGLMALESLPHCGAVIPGDDVARVTRLLRTLRDQVTERSALLARHGVGDLEELRRRAPDLAPARTVVLLDAFGGFTATYERADPTLVEAIPRLVADGRAVGVHLVITADRRTAVPLSLVSTVPRRFVLRMGTEDEYGALGLDVRRVRGATLPPGGGFLPGELQFQTALVGPPDSVEAQLDAVTAEGRRLQLVHGELAAPTIALLPDHVPAGGLPPTDGLVVPVALGENRMTPAAVDLRDEHLVVLGPFRSGRTTALETIARRLSLAPDPPELWLLAPRRNRLPGMDCWTKSARGVEACRDLVAELLEVVTKRAAEDVDHPPLVVVLDDGGEIDDMTVKSSLEQIVRRGRDAGVRFVASFERSAGAGFETWIKELRKDGQGLLLDADARDGDALSVRLPRRTAAEWPPGRAVLVRAGTVEEVQVATYDTAGTIG